jgi:pseudaminic acid synthase
MKLSTLTKSSPFIVAEISANHNGSINNAKKLIKLAKINGADAIKLQTYTADMMTIKSNQKDFKIKSGLWKNYYLWDLYDKAKTPLDWHKELFSYAKRLKIICFSSPFDETAVDLLEKLKCPIYKVASFEMTDLELIKKIASTKKPMIISTGMASLKEIDLTFNTAKKYGARDIALLYCVSKYPSNISDFNITNIEIMKKRYKCPIGFSDHSLDNKLSSLAVAKGATIFEKHIALKNQKKGFDIEFSLKGNEIKEYVKNINDSYHLVKKKFFYRNKSESKSKVFRRSIYVIEDIKKGNFFTRKNIKVIRPGYGLDPIYLKKILGKKSTFNLKRGSPLKKKFL